QLVAYDERAGAGWISAEAEIAPGARATRTIVVMDSYLVDRLTWAVSRDADVDLPLHADVVLDEGDPRPASLDGGVGLEDGFRFVRDATTQRVEGGVTIGGHALV